MTLSPSIRPCPELWPNGSPPFKLLTSVSTTTKRPSSVLVRTSSPTYLSAKGRKHLCKELPESMCKQGYGFSLGKRTVLFPRDISQARATVDVFMSTNDSPIVVSDGFIPKIFQVAGIDPLQLASCSRLASISGLQVASTCISSCIESKSILRKLRSLWSAKFAVPPLLWSVTT